jgi:hypothetical protein
VKILQLDIASFPLKSSISLAAINKHITGHYSYYSPASEHIKEHGLASTRYALNNLINILLLKMIARGPLTIRCQAHLRRRRGGRPASTHVAPFLSEWQEKL